MMLLAASKNAAFLLPSFIHTDTDYVIATRPPSGNIDGGLVEIRGYDGL